MAYSFDVTVDSADPHTLADWWADALGWEVEPVDEVAVRRMVAEGEASEDDTTRHHGTLVWKAGTAIRHPEGVDRTPRVVFQLVPEPKTVKNRVHLDVRVGPEEAPAVVERLLAGGATFVRDGGAGPYAWTTLADPEDNELCVLR